MGDGTILKTIDGGKHWVEKGPISGIAEDIFFLDQNFGWIVGTGPGVAKGIGGNDPGIHLLTNGTAKIWTSSDGGDSWTEEILSNGAWLLGAYFTDLNSGWAVGNGGLIFKYSHSLPIPSAPSELKALAISASEILLTWSDNSTNEEGFSIFRRDGTGGNFRLLASVAANKTTFSDSSLTTGTTYWYRVRAFNTTGSSAKSADIFATAGATAVAVSKVVPLTFSLEQNYPNPFNTSTLLQYSLPFSATVSLKIYDLLGREIKTLVSGQQAAGNYRFQFDSQDLPAGLYFYRLKTEQFDMTRKMLVIK